MSEESSQTYEGGTLTVSTTELNPVLLTVEFLAPYPEDGDVPFLKDKIKTDKQVIDLSRSWQAGVDTLYVTAKNEGDEEITVRALVYIDGALVLEEVSVPLTPGAGASWGEHGNVSWVTTGKHNIAWRLNAQEGHAIGGAAEQVYVDDNVDYYCYTLPLDAIATEVLIVQGTSEKHWLSGTPTGFINSEIQIKENTGTYFKFKLSNLGDEPVKMNVDHIVGDHYESGFLVSGVHFDSIEKNLEIAAGSTSVINTVPFIVDAGVITIGSFRVSRSRHLI